jgi:hypothetical protein
VGASAKRSKDATQPMRMPLVEPETHRISTAEHGPAPPARIRGPGNAESGLTRSNREVKIASQKPGVIQFQAGCAVNRRAGEAVHATGSNVSERLRTT